MDTNGLDLMGRRRRRRHSTQFKENVVRECLQPGVSIASVALRHGLNANMLRKWVIDGEHKLPAPRVAAIEGPEEAKAAAEFIPLSLPAPAGAPSEIRIELQRAGTTVTVTWPSSAARDCAAWLREWLR